MEDEAVNNLVDGLLSGLISIAITTLLFNFFSNHEKESNDEPE